MLSETFRGVSRNQLITRAIWSSPISIQALVFPASGSNVPSATKQLSLRTLLRWRR